MRIGIIGASNIGGTLGKLWAEAGHEILFGTRRPETLKDLISKIGAKAKASAGTPEDAAFFGEVLLFAAPYSAWPTFATENAQVLTGKIHRCRESVRPARWRNCRRRRKEGSGRGEAIPHNSFPRRRSSKPLIRSSGQTFASRRIAMGSV